MENSVTDLIKSLHIDKPNGIKYIRYILITYYGGLYEQSAEACSNREGVRGLRVLHGGLSHGRRED